MILLERGQAYDCSDPRLVFYGQQEGWATDVAELSFQVFDVSDDTKALNPVQVYPAVEGDKQAVDVDNACPTGGKIRTGQYVGAWSVPATASFGRHELRWFWKWEVGGAEYTSAVPLEVLSSAGFVQGPFYCSVADMRDEGLTVAQASDARVLQTIHIASRYIEKVTGRFFEARRVQMRIDGRGHSNLVLHQPIILMEEIRVLATYTPDPLTTINADDRDTFKVYNRHLSGMIHPDDREDPRVALVFGDLSVPGVPQFYDGAQNVELDGVFGYTDPDGSPWGATPELIRRACILIVLRDVWKGTDTTNRDDYTSRHRITQEKTRDQSITRSPVGGSGASGGGIGGGRLGTAFTGDPEIDRILALYIRPLMLGAA